VIPQSLANQILSQQLINPLGLHEPATNQGVIAEVSESVPKNADVVSWTYSRLIGQVPLRSTSQQGFLKKAIRN
jgi:hypothetical protein